jgi:hypothetical protein
MYSIKNPQISICKPHALQKGSTDDSTTAQNPVEVEEGIYLPPNRQCQGDVQDPRDSRG